MPREDGPRLEVTKHQAAETRLRESVLRRERGEAWDYPDRDADIELCQRKERERGPAGVRKVLGRGGCVSYGVV
jgi:hypothetical protein